MKLLWLGTSNDIEGYLPEEQRSPALAAKMLSEATGLPVDVRARAIWPTADLPALVERWMERDTPDMVFLRVVTYWCAYESVPLKLQRMLPWIGKPLGDLGQKAAGTSWIGTTRPFHWSRLAAQRIIGGATPFEPGEIVERMEACIRAILRHEDVTLLVQGPRHVQRYQQSDRAERRGEQRRLVVHRALRRLCEDLRVTYAGPDRPAHEDVQLTTLGDRLHYDPAAHEVEAEYFGQWLIKAWRDALA